MKKLLLLLLVVAVAGAGFLYVRLGSIVKGAIETHGPKMLGAPVTVGLVTVSPFSGKGSVRRLRIGNPEGFKSESAVTLGRLDVELDLKSLRGERLLIKEIVLDEPGVTLEAGPGGTNLQRLQKNLADYSGSGEAKKDSGGGRKLEISRLSVRRGKVTAIVPALKSAPQEAALPDIELQGIGAKPGGATAAEAARQVLDEIVRASLKSAGGAEALLKKGLEAVGGKQAADAVDKVKGLFKK